MDGIMTHAQAFLKEIDTFLAESGMAASSFGKAAVGDPNFVSDLRDHDREPRSRTVTRVQAFMRQSNKTETAA
jgi:hypothetical protein